MNPLYKNINESWEELTQRLLVFIDSDGKSGLHLAAEDYNIDIASMLVDAGADVNAKNKNGDTPLHYASENRCTGIVELLIKAGANVNAKNNYDDTPLHICEYANVKPLIEAGADILALNNGNQTPMDVALLINNQHKVDLLQKASVLKQCKIKKAIKHTDE